MNHPHHHDQKPAQMAGGSPHRAPATLLSSALPRRLAIAGAMAGVMWLTILWALA